MSRIVILLLCALCSFAQDPATVKIPPPFPDSSPNPNPTSSSSTSTPITTTTGQPTTPNTTTTGQPTTPTTTTTGKPTTPTTKTTTPTTASTTAKPTTPTTIAPTPAPTPVGPLPVNNFTGNYSGTNRICLMMKMAVQFELLGENATMINVTDKVSSNVTCASNTLETLFISWENNNLTFTFNKNDSKYEIQSIVATILPPGGNATTYSHQKSEFSVSAKQSYKCAKDQALNLTGIASNITLAKIHISHLQYQAFMNTTTEQYDSAWYCDATNTPDVVPIVVGCVLAVLVVLVLVAYLFGRRRCQARGYLSM